MLNLIPFASAWWKMTNMKSQASFISKFLQLEFPKAISIAITAPTVGGNQQMFATGLCLNNLDKPFLPSLLCVES